MGLNGAGPVYESREFAADFSTASGFTMRSGHLDRQARRVVATPPNFLANLPLGALVRVNDTYNASAGNFLVFGKETLAHNVVTLIRNKLGTARTLGATGGKYEGCQMDAFLEDTYFASLGSVAKAAALTVDVPVYTGDRQTLYTIKRRAFLPSYGEIVGGVGDGVYTGLFSNTNADRQAFTEANAGAAWFIRTAWIDQVGQPNYFHGFLATGGVMLVLGTTSNCVRPCIALPATQRVDTAPNPDGSYNLLGTQTTVTASFDYAFEGLDKRPVNAAVSMKHYENPGTLITFQLCNNMGDGSPAWENAEMNASHTFANKTKTAPAWAIGVRMHISVGVGEGSGGAVGEFVVQARV